MTEEELILIMSQEGDEDHWVSNEFNCHIKRNTLGAWCGYVDLPYIEGCEYETNINVHGGVTYKEFIEEFITIGFDCNHSDDLTLYQVKDNEKWGHFWNNFTYRTKEYVKNEVESMIYQLIRSNPILHSYIRDKKIDDIFN